MEEKTGALIVLAFGLWFMVSPQTAFQFKAWWSKLVGVKMTGSKKAMAYYRITGFILVVIAILLYL